MKETLKAAVYGLADLAARGQGIERVIEGEKIRFPARWSRWYASNYETNTFRFLRAHCAVGNTVMDIGAHLGLFSICMSRWVGPSGHVYSFEPTPVSRDVLKETVRLNGLEDFIIVQPEAVTRKSGTATFFDTGTIASNANSLVQTERSHHAITVNTTSLDDFVTTHQLSVHCLKIDVEGAELDLMCGGRHTFEKFRPAALLSVHPSALRQAGQNLVDLWAVLQDLDMLVRLLEDYGGQIVEPPLMTEQTFCEQKGLFDVGIVPRSG